MVVALCPLILWEPTETREQLIVPTVASFIPSTVEMLYATVSPSEFDSLRFVSKLSLVLLGHALWHLGMTMAKTETEPGFRTTRMSPSCTRSSLHSLDTPL